MRAGVLGEVPDADKARTIARNDLTLVGVDDNIVYRAAMVVASLDGTRPRFPYLDGTVLGASHHPLALAVERNARDIACVALKCKERARVGRLDVVELDGMVTGRRQEPLVRRDA